MEFIQSLQNPKVKSWYQLKSKKGRDKAEAFMLEGYKLIEEAIRSNEEILHIIVDEQKEIPNELIQLAEKHQLNTSYIKVTIPIIEKLSETESPQGIIAIVKQANHQLEKVVTEENPFLLLLDEIQDPGNLGTIIRSADAAGVDAIILGKGSVELYNSKVIRSAMGSIFHLPVIPGDLTDILPLLKQKGYKIVGTSPYTDDNYFSLDFNEKLAVMVGNEAKGLSEERSKQVDRMVKIPMLGQAESLNVAMATTLVLYENVRQKAQIMK